MNANDPPTGSPIKTATDSPIKNVPWALPLTDSPVRYLPVPSTLSPVRNMPEALPPPDPPIRRTPVALPSIESPMINPPRAFPVTISPITTSPGPLPSTGLPARNPPGTAPTTLSPSRYPPGPILPLQPFPIGNAPFVQDPDGVDTKLMVCIGNLLAANSVSNDIAGNMLLDKSEFLDFLVLQSNCDLISSLSQTQVEVFRQLACRCLEMESTSPNCCSDRNARVSITGADLLPENQPQDLKDALAEVCLVTASVIAAACSIPPVTAPFVPPGMQSSDIPLPARPNPTSPPFQTFDPPSASKITPFPVRTLSPAMMERTFVPITPTRGEPALSPDGPVTTDPTFAPQNDGRLVNIPTQMPTIARNDATNDGRPVYIPTQMPTIAINDATEEAPSRPVVASSEPVANPAVWLPTESLSNYMPSSIRETELPAVVPTIRLPAICITSILASDLDSNGYLNEIEFAQFAQVLTGCAVSDLTQGLRDAFIDLQSRSCFVVPANEAVFCWQSPQPGVFIGPASSNPQKRKAIETNLLAEICQLTNDVIPDTCVFTPTIPPTTAPTTADDLSDFEFCAEQLVSADLSADDVLDQGEYLVFLRHYGQCSELPSLNIGHQAVFLTLASECTEANCALPGNAKLNISGAAIPRNLRTIDQNQRLVRICRTAIGLTNGEKCVKPSKTPPPETWCSASLVTSDSDVDGFLNNDEYLSFMRQEFSPCAQLSSLSLVQRVVFQFLACFCIFEPGAGLDCCFTASPKIDVSGAGLPSGKRKANQTSIISSVCSASNATVEVGCRASPWTSVPNQVSPKKTVPTAVPIIGTQSNSHIRASQASHLQLNFTLLALICSSFTAFMS